MPPAASRGSLHLGFELFQARRRGGCLHVPYKGGGRASYCGRPHAAIVATMATSWHVAPEAEKRSGQRDQAQPVLPDVPTITEAGVPYEAGNWIGLSPRQAPPTRLARNSQGDFRRSRNARGAKASRGRRLGDLRMSPAEFGSFMAKDD